MKYKPAQIEIMDTTHNHVGGIIGPRTPHEKLMMARLSLEETESRQGGSGFGTGFGTSATQSKMICNWAAARNIFPGWRCWVLS